MTDATRKPQPIAHIRNPALTGDGERFAFEVVTVTGQVLDLEIAANELGTMLQFFVPWAAKLAQKASDDGVEFSRPSTLSPIPIQGIGSAASDSPDHVLLLVNLFAFDLAFEIPHTQLADLAQSLSRTGLLLSGGGPKPN